MSPRMCFPYSFDDLFVSSKLTRSRKSSFHLKCTLLPETILSIRRHILQCRRNNAETIIASPGPPSLSAISASIGSLDMNQIPVITPSSISSAYPTTPVVGIASPCVYRRKSFRLFSQRHHRNHRNQRSQRTMLHRPIHSSVDMCFRERVAAFRIPAELLLALPSI